MLLSVWSFSLSNDIMLNDRIDATLNNFGILQNNDRARVQGVQGMKQGRVISFRFKWWMNDTLSREMGNGMCYAIWMLQ